MSLRRFWTCAARTPLEDIQGRSFKAVCNDNDPGVARCLVLRIQLRETVSVHAEHSRRIRTDDWKFMHYPHGDGSPDRHIAEMYDLKNDPQELTNLAEHTDHAAKRQELETRLAALLAKEGLTPAN